MKVAKLLKRKWNDDGSEMLAMASESVVADAALDLDAHRDILVETDGEEGPEYHSEFFFSGEANIKGRIVEVKFVHNNQRYRLMARD